MTDEEVFDWGDELEVPKFIHIEPKPYNKEYEDNRFYKKADAEALARITSRRKADIKHNPYLEEIEAAKNWIKKRKLDEKNWKAQKKDLDGDEIEEVVVFDKYNRPFAVNGYRLVPSHMPERQYYIQTHPKPLDRINESKRQFYNSDKFWNAGAFDKYGMRTIADKPKKFKEWEDAGWAYPREPNELRSIYSILCEGVLKVDCINVIKSIFKYDENKRGPQNLLYPVTVFAKLYKFYILPELEAKVDHFNRRKKDERKRVKLMEDVRKVINEQFERTKLMPKIVTFYEELCRYLIEKQLVNMDQSFRTPNPADEIKYKVYNYNLRQEVNAFVKIYPFKEEEKK